MCSGAREEEFEHAMLGTLLAINYSSSVSAHAIGIVMYRAKRHVMIYSVLQVAMHAWGAVDHPPRLHCYQSIPEKHKTNAMSCDTIANVLWA